MKNDLTREEKRTIDMAVIRFLWRFFFTVSTHVIMFSLMSFSLFCAVFLYMDGNAGIDLFGSIFIGIFTLKNVLKNIGYDFAQLETTVNSVLKK